MARRQTYELDADEGKLVDAYRNLTAEQRRMLAEGQRINQSTKQQAQSTGYLTNQWKSLVATAAGFIGVNSLIQKGIGLIKEYDNHLKKIDEKQVKAAGGAIPLAALQRPEDVRRVLREAAALSAERGVMPEVGFNYFQRGQSVRGTYEGGKESALAAMQLGLLTQDHETAAETIKIARELGMSQKEFNSLIVGAAATSAADEAVFAGTASYWPLFTKKGGDPEKYFGAAITNVLSQRIDSSHLPTYVQAVSRTLTDVGAEDVSGLKRELTLQERITKSMEAEGRTFADLNNFERLMAIRGYVQRTYGEVTPETLQMAGISEQRERTAMATLMTPENFQLLAKVLSEAPEFAEQYDIGERLTAIQMEPAIREKYLEDRAAAQAEAYAFMGPESTVARGRTAQVRAVGVETGYGLGVDEDTGEAGYVRQVQAYEGFQEAGIYHTPYGVYIDKDERARADRLQQDRLEEALRKNDETLRKILEKEGQIAENTKQKPQFDRVVMDGGSGY